MSEQSLSETEEEKVLEIIVRNQMKIKELQEENETLKAYYKQSPESFKAGSKRVVGKFYVQVSENSRIDDGLAKANLDPRIYKRITKEVVDTAKAKKVLYGDQLEKVKKHFENKIEVGLN